MNESTGNAASIPTPEDLEQKRVREEELAPVLAAEFLTFSERGTTPYMHRKLIPELYGARIKSNPDGEPILIVPLYLDGSIVNYQRIYSTKFKQPDGGETDKFTAPGARTKGTSFRLEDFPVAPEATIYICEGFATGASIFQALGESAPVVVALYAANLPGVVLSYAALFPKASFVICADDDRWKPGRGNAGRKWAETAREALRELGRQAEVRYPIFPEARAEGGGKGPTDFNDLHALFGLEEVKAQVLSQREDPRDRVGPPIPSKGNTAIEAALVTTLLEHFEGRLMRQGKDFFLWEETHWRHLDPLSTPDTFKRLLDIKAGGTMKFKDISSAYNRFVIHVPHVPDGVNLFAPSSLKQNFTNGTLELLPQPDGTFKQRLRPFEREDWLTHQHGFEYREGGYNTEFEAALDRIWHGDADIEAKKQAYFEVLGAALVPAFRKVVLFVGKPKGGKSTLVLFATKLVDPKYACSVDPTQFKGFNFSSMAGKLLNYDTDINLVEPIGDSILKKIEDRIPLRIERKGLADIYAPIPGLHAFACNRMPVSREGGQAYDRRMLVLRCDSYQAAEGYIQDYASTVWDQNSQGIVTRALEGLRRLCERGGHFTIPVSSRLAIETWQADQADLVSVFLADWKEGEVLDLNNKPLAPETAEMVRSAAWDVFKVWVERTAPKASHPSRNRFYARLRELGIGESKIHGYWTLSGFGVGVGAEGSI